MPALPRQQAADELGISPATLLRITRDGTGKIQKGGGRGRKTLFDVETIRAARGPRSASPQCSPEFIEQLARGARALSIAQILMEDFATLYRSGAFAQFRVPPDRCADLVRFLALRVIDRVHEHLHIADRPSFAQLMEITES
jgi:hypothetical protein